MFSVDVIDVQPMAERKLKLRFSDQQVGIVDVDSIVGEYSGVFSPLLDPGFFQQVRVNDDLGTIMWPNGADLCPDVLYAHATGRTRELLAFSEP
ncbi:putative uncharacterized protein [Burkholderiales bacterium GJ-E10]|nr:putative uncharacterized protein [Burkholderiales bacterium GJ-E10]